MESKFHEQLYRTEPEVTMGDLAKVILELRESVKKYMEGLGLREKSVQH